MDEHGPTKDGTEDGNTALRCRTRVDAALARTARAIPVEGIQKILPREWPSAQLSQLTERSTKEDRTTYKLARCPCSPRNPRRQRHSQHSLSVLGHNLESSTRMFHYVSFWINKQSTLTKHTTRRLSSLFLSIKPGIF